MIPLWIASLTENASHATNNNITLLTTTLTRIANSYSGITGSTSLNQAGDRKYANYDFWEIVKRNSIFEWELVNSSSQVNNNYEVGHG